MGKNKKEHDTESLGLHGNRPLYLLHRTFRNSVLTSQELFWKRLAAILFFYGKTK